MKILIIRFSSIGDIAWTSPVIRCCKNQIPNAEIHFCTKYKYSTLVAHNPFLDKVHYLQDSLNDLLKALKEENFDYIIDLHGKIRSYIILLYLRKKSFTYNKLTFERFLFTRFQINLMPKNTHVADRYMDTVKRLGVINDNNGLDFFISSQDEININQIQCLFKNGYAALVIGASQPTKKLPLHKLSELCLKIKMPIILIGGSEDKLIGDDLINHLVEQGASLQIFNSCGIFNIGQSASVIKQSEIVYGHDTGLTQIAAAFGKKIYSFWGSTSPVGLAPYQANNIIVENNTLKCRPCSKAGRKSCPLGHFKCMNDLEFSF